MILVTTETVPGKKTIKTIGLVRGNTIRARHLGHDFMAFLRNVVGGEIVDYTKMMAEAREQALDRLAEDAAALGANAVVGLRITTTMMMQSAASVSGLRYSGGGRGIERTTPSGDQVADAANRTDTAITLWKQPKELFPQGRDMHIHDPAFLRCGFSPNPVE